LINKDYGGAQPISIGERGERATLVKIAFLVKFTRTIQGAQAMGMRCL